MKEEVRKIVAAGLFKTRMPLISNPENIPLPDVAYSHADILVEYLEEKGYEVTKKQHD